MSELPFKTATVHPDTAPYPAGATKCLTVLSRLLFNLRNGPDADQRDDPTNVFDVHPEELPKLLALADAHHIPIRALQPLQLMMTVASKHELAEWAANAIESERRRIENALSFLDQICHTLETEGCEVMVIKSLDHWPDLGSDLDLFTSAQPGEVIHVMNQHFNSSLAPRSWGDRLANKWNFILPGLPELVEVHIGRLGQTGEQTTIANSLLRRGRLLVFGTHTVRVPAPEDRLIVATLQRMYRHFYLRLCDIADTARLSEHDTVDYIYLRSAAEAAGIWKGVATLLAIVSDYIKHYRGFGLDLPSFVGSAAQFGGDQLIFRRFLRIPILPHSVRLYTSQLRSLALRGELEGTFRLSLLPCLATAAIVEQKLTGTDKGIW